MRFRRKDPSPSASSAAAALRPLLYGDVPRDEWPPPGAAADAEPWATFVRARDAIAAGRRDAALQGWLSVARNLWNSHGISGGDAQRARTRGHWLG